MDSISDHHDDIYLQYNIVMLNRQNYTPQTHSDQRGSGTILNSCFRQIPVFHCLICIAL